MVAWLASVYAEPAPSALVAGVGQRVALGPISWRVLVQC